MRATKLSLRRAGPRVLAVFLVSVAWMALGPALADPQQSPSSDAGFHDGREPHGDREAPQNQASSQGADLWGGDLQVALAAGGEQGRPIVAVFR